jgi:hypothetical protein
MRDSVKMLLRSLRSNKWQPMMEDQVVFGRNGEAKDGIGEELFRTPLVLLWCKALRFWLEGGLLVVLNRAYAFGENNAWRNHRFIGEGKIRRTCSQSKERTSIQGPRASSIATIIENRQNRMTNHEDTRNPLLNAYLQRG